MIIQNVDLLNPVVGNGNVCSVINFDLHSAGMNTVSEVGGISIFNGHRPGALELHELQRRRNPLK